ncbi:hypothetical protein RVR_319 [Actinacidiphila reveromycinica]|uniref:Uncharacterized protein n=1 Tax=Actinacidiphila reveromycinica TaxID=659352 RepID=A0A7U3UMU2_9ACTN|nr:hypothetical protein [Streptomyces sp. SN-593]BBA95456.1 hypothetical protein RVR_319 [Streptomyces sp. SN-593]
MALVPTEPVNRTILLLDIESFTQRDNVEQVYLRRGLYDVAEEILAAAGVGPSQQYREDRGDGLIILLSGDISKAVLLKTLLWSTPDILRGYNRLAARSAQMRLRIVLASGEVGLDPRNGTVGGLVGHDLNQACRLLDAPVLRDALRQRPEEFVLCVSRSVYEGVVRHHYPGLPPEDFHNVTAAVKKDVLDAWLHGPVPHGAPRPEETSGRGAAAEPAATVEAPPPGGRSPGDGRAAPPRRRSGRTYVTAGLVVAALGAGAVIGACLAARGSHAPEAGGPASPQVSPVSPRRAVPASPGAPASPSPRGAVSSGSAPVAPSDAGVFYHEQFTDHSRWTDDGDREGASYTTASYLVYSGISSVRTYVIGYPAHVAQLYPKAPSDLGIEVWARHDADSDNGYGVVCHAHADKSGYYFTVWGDSASIEKKAPGKQGWTTLATVRHSPAIRQVGQNHFAVSCADAPDGRSVALAFSLNSTLLDTVTDRTGPLVTEGTVALAAGSDPSTRTPDNVEFSSLALKRP